MLKTVLLVLALLSAQAVLTEAHRYYSAYADGEDSPTTAIITLYEHAGKVCWTLNVTDAAPGAIQASVEDGDPAISTSVVVPLAADFVDNGDGSVTASGVFGAAAIDPAAGMAMADFENHLGMGHMWLKVSTPEGAVYGAFEEANAAGEAASGSSGSSGASSSSMAMDMAGMDASVDAMGDMDASSSQEAGVMPAVSAMEGAKEGEDHSHHRRMLRSA